MLDRGYIDKHLSDTICYSCGKNLKGAHLTPISEIPVALIAHTKCPNCQAESMVTITIAGSGAMPVVSDLTGAEMKKFIGVSSVTVDELLDLHKMLKRKPIWKLLEKQETNSKKK